MTTYYWVPMADDGNDRWATGRSAQVIGSRVLPRRVNHNDYPPGTQSQGRWGNLNNNDIIYIGCHGVATSLSYIGWSSNGRVTKWTAERLAEVVAANLSVAQKLNNTTLSLHLTACWGANRFTPFSESFGKTFARKLREKNVKGTLTAYQGAGQLNVYGDYQIGSSRWTSALLSGKDKNTGNTPGFVRSGKRNRFGVRIAHNRSDKAVTWQLAS